MSAKMGRPLKSEEPLTKSVIIRMTETMHEKLLDYAEENHMSKTDVARKALEDLLE